MTRGARIEWALYRCRRCEIEKEYQGIIWRVVKFARCAGEDPEENCGGELEFLRKRGVEPTAEEIASRPKKVCVDCVMYAPAFCPLHRPPDVEALAEAIAAFPKEKPVPRKDDEEEPDFPEHSLFPCSEDEESYDVSFIQVTRWENGRQVWGPVLPAIEIPDELALIDMFGGGQYVLISRQPQKRDKSKPGGVTGRRKITLPGRPKPLSSDPTPEEEADASNLPRAIPAPASGGMTGGGGFENVLIAMMSMQQQAQERASVEARASQAREAENSKSFLTMLVTMMQSGKSDMQNMFQMMMTLSSQQQQSMIQLLPAVMGSRGGGPEEMAKFAELFKTLGFAAPNGAKTAAKDDDNSIGAILANGADVLQGIMALKGGLGGAAPGPVNGEASPPALPGSAQEMLERMKRGG